MAVLATVVMLLTISQLVGLGQSTTMFVMVAVGTYLCVMYGLLLRGKKPHWFFYLALVILLILSAYGSI